MEPNQILKKYGIQGGILYGALASLIMLLMSVLGAQNNTLVSIIGLALSIAIVAWACMQFKNENEGFLSISEGIKIGLITGVIGGLIYAVYMYLHYEIIYPNELITYQEEALLEVEKQIENGAIQQIEEIEMAKKAVVVMTSTFTLATLSLFTQLFKAFIFGLGCGLIFRNS
jgi:amino acid transporter